MQNKCFPTIGNCYKCNTANSELFQYRTGYFICKANSCWDEECERSSGRHVILNRRLEEYRRLIARANNASSADSTPSGNTFEFGDGDTFQFGDGDTFEFGNDT